MNEKYDYTAAERKQRERQKMTELGFRYRNYWVHEHDGERVLNYITRLKNSRLGIASKRKNKMHPYEDLVKQHSRLAEDIERFEALGFENDDEKEYEYEQMNQAREALEDEFANLKDTICEQAAIAHVFSAADSYRGHVCEFKKRFFHITSIEDEHYGHQTNVTILPDFVNKENVSAYFLGLEKAFTDGRDYERLHGKKRA